MSSNIIVELRQQDAITVENNGDYECQLSKDVVIENGDVVQLTKCFIDTVKESNINITEDLYLTIDSNVYFNNWIQLTGSYIDNDNVTIPCVGTTPTSPCFKRFIPYLGIDGGSLPGYSTYTGFQWFINSQGAGYYPAFNMTYSYTNYMGLTQHITTTIPENGKLWKNKVYIDTFNIIAKNNTVKFVSATYPITNWEQQGAIGSAVATKIYTPFNFTTEIILPAGIYSPQQLSTYISEQLSFTKAGKKEDNSIYMDQSNFQFAATDFDNGKASPDGRLNPTTKAPIPLTEQTTFISDDGILSYQFPADSNYIIGTSQIALEYDADSDKFVLNYMHMPMYDNVTGANISVRFLHEGLLSNGNVMGVAQNSGIYFNSLVAKNINGKVVDFWQGVLGFDLNQLCVKTASTVSNSFGLTGFINLTSSLVPGVNITDGYYGLDAGIIKGISSWYQRQTVPATQAGITSTINNTISIEADKTIDLLLNKFSHYVLMTDLGFQNNNFIGQKWYRNINGIISKYYAYGSYAFAESDAAIQYVHSGASISLKSVRVRLLKSDKTIDLNLGDDNTVILQVIKGGSLPPVSTPKKA
jgi:hypothetical protein